MEVNTMLSTCNIICKVIPAQVLLEVIQAVKKISSLPDKILQSLYSHYKQEDHLFSKLPSQ
jgi:predicted nucleic acid-binding protein